MIAFSKFRMVDMVKKKAASSVGGRDFSCLFAVGEKLLGIPRIGGKADEVFVDEKNLLSSSLSFGLRPVARRLSCVVCSVRTSHGGTG